MAIKKRPSHTFETASYNCDRDRISYAAFVAKCVWHLRSNHGSHPILMAIKKLNIENAELYNCDRDRIRTYDRLLRRQMLYPAELRDHWSLFKRPENKKGDGLLHPLQLFSRGGRIRTCDLLLPKQAR